MNSTEQTPRLEEGDTEFLNKIFSYSVGAITRLSMEGFKALWAERFFGNPEEDKSAVFHDWEFSVALGRNVPVYLTDEQGNPLWIFPPIVGELSPGFTATRNSLDFMNKEIKLIRERFVHQGMKAETKMLESIKPKASNKEMLSLHMFMIRRECGYLTEEEEGIVQEVLSGVKSSPVPGQPTESSADEEYDY